MSSYASLSDYEPLESAAVIAWDSHHQPVTSV